MHRLSRNNTLISLCVSVLFFVFGASAVHAETVGIVQMLVQDSSGNVYEGIPASLYDSSGNYLQYGTTNASGYVNYFSVDDGSYSIQLRPGQASSCSNCGLFENEDIAITVDSASAPFNDALGTTLQSLTNYTLVQATRYVTVTVVDQNSTVVAGLYVYGWTDNGDYVYGTTNSAGEYQFAVAEDNTATWDIGAYPSNGGYTSDYEYDVSLASTGETAVALSVIAADSTVTFNFLDANGAAFTIPTDIYSSVYCYDTDTYLVSFSETVTAGASSAEIEVVSGYTYQCNMWIDGYASSGATVTVADTTGATANITVLERNAQIQFQYLNSAGDVITDLNDFYAYASSMKDANGVDNYADYAYEQGSAGEATLDVVDGYTYAVSGYFTNTTETGAIQIASTTYMNAYQSVEVVADKDEIQVVQITLEESDATIKVTLRNSSGKAPNYGYVSAWQESAETDGSWGTYVGESTNSSGVATLNVVSGGSYHIYAYTDDSYTAGSIPPPEQIVTPVSGETVEVTMQSLESDFTLTVTTSIRETTASTSSAEYTYCYAYNPSLGAHTYTEVQNDSGTLSLVTGTSWYVGCMAYEGDDFYWAFDQKYTPDPEKSKGTLALELDSAGAYYPETSYTFSATSANTITLPDGVSTLTVPANAIASSGNVTIIVKTGTGYSVNDSSFPVSVYEFTALDDTGNVVTDFSSNLTLNLYYDESLLDELDLTEEDLLGSFYNDTTSQWEAPSSSSIDTEKNIITISLSHFSLYGGVTDRKVSAEPSSPLALTVKKIKAQQAVIDWKKPEGKVKTYRVEVRKFGKAKTVKKYKGIKKTEKRITKLKADTKYQVRVKACNAKGCSNFTDWKSFTTK
ncbi:MAG: hypothetical protein ACD_41C00038G0005 [uncultured bacterium]|nr:MAG: hypothetical protein ACD_41C00038G0005 [uncultured bacterium]HBY73581.1 hypothetical protein [Candidatus Kerfeldbacteria bacterium]